MPAATPGTGWTPFRPTAADLERIGRDVAPISDLQARLVDAHPDLTLRDRVAHQCQLAGGRVRLEVAAEVALPLAGIGLFQPGAVHTGIGRLSTGLGCPHAETDPDFLGLMLAFRTAAGQRVDFLAINDPTAPTDDHRAFMALLGATTDSATPFASGVGLLDQAMAQTKFGASLVRQLGVIDGTKVAAHVVGQTSTTWRSSSAWQNYWTGVVELGGTAGKFRFTPTAEANPHRPTHPPEHHLSRDWRTRQSAGPVTFQLDWLPFIDQDVTPTEELTRPWVERPQRVGLVTFPQQVAEGDEAWLWAALAAEIGANPGHWVHDKADSIPEPATEFDCARKQAYRLSQDGRAALPQESYAEVFTTGIIGPDLAAELRRRRAAKAAALHIDGGPRPPEA